MKKLTLGIFFLVILFVTNCAIGPTHGFIYTSTKFAGTINPENNVKTNKEATGCQHTVLYLYTVGDAGAGSVALANKIKKVATIDHSTTSILTGLYRNYCTIVTGEE